MEMFRLLSFGDTKLARPTSLLRAVPRNPMNIVLVQKLLISILDHAFCYKHYVDGMGQIGQNGDEGFGHFAAHVEVLVLVLEEVYGVGDFAV